MFLVSSDLGPLV